MGKYIFRAENGFCPKCEAFGRIWYIFERNIYGNKYEHCLMSMPIEEPDGLCFKNKKEIAAWLNGDKIEAGEYTDEMADYIINYNTVPGFNFAEKAMLEKDGVKYRYDREKNLLTEYREDKQETGYFDNYYDCLKAAKEILENIEKLQEKQTVQMTLDDILEGGKYGEINRKERRSKCNSA